MKVEILKYTEKPLTTIGLNASECYGTKIKDEGHPRRIAEHCLRSGHGRNLEFADITFKVTASARVIREIYTHIGGSPTRVQSSTRFITYNDFNYITPIGMTVAQEEIYHKAMENIRESYNLLKVSGLPNDITGYVLPLAMESTCVVKMNARTLENMFNQRECARALYEFRKIMATLKYEVKELGEEWNYIADNYFKVKCDKLGYCPEDYSCDRVKKGVVLTKEEFKQAIKAAEGLKLDKRMSRENSI